MLCILSTRSSGDLARELKEDPRRAGVGGPTPACKRRADQGGGCEFSCGLPRLRPGLEVTFWSRSEERGAGGVGGVGGEDAHGSRSCSVGDHFGVGPRVGDTVGRGLGMWTALARLMAMGSEGVQFRSRYSLIPTPGYSHGVCSRRDKTCTKHRRDGQHLAILVA